MKYSSVLFRKHETKTILLEVTFRIINSKTALIFLCLNQEQIFECFSFKLKSLFFLNVTGNTLQRLSGYTLNML